MTNFFAGCETPDQVRTKFRKLARQYHPDLHPDMPNATRIMQEINAQHEQILRSFSGREYAKSETSEQSYTYTYQKETEDKITNAILGALGLRMKGVTIEVVGSWVWVYGSPDPSATKPYKDSLGKNGLGFKWSGKHNKWYFSPTPYRRSYSKKTYGEIKGKYGSRVVQEAV